VRSAALPSYRADGGWTLVDFKTARLSGNHRMPRKLRPETERARRSRRRLRPNVSRTGDWVLGRSPAPFVVEQPRPYRPDVLLLMDVGADEVVAIAVLEPGRTPAEVAGWAAERLPRGAPGRRDRPSTQDRTSGRRHEEKANVCLDGRPGSR
jgi:hypothetical protein